MQRYFTKDKNFKLSDEDLYHINKVMRMKKNDKIEVVLNQKVYLCNIDYIDSDTIKISPLEDIKQDNELDIDITLGIALIKEQKFDFILQKATELGANNFIPLQAERSVIKIDINKEASKVERWRKICKEASEQSHRNIIPDVANSLKIKDLDTSTYDLKLICSLQKEATNVKEILQKKQNCDKILIVVGPEGGFTKEEEQELVDKGFIRVSLGKRILRAETVPLYVLSIINYEFMR